MTDNLTEHEIEILRCVAGEKEWPIWGSWVGACLSFLHEGGYTDGEVSPRITEKGRKALPRPEA